MADQLPDAAALPLFDYRDESGNLVPLDSGVDPLPRKITEYRVDPANWEEYEIEPTIEGILTTSLRALKCKMCLGTTHGETRCPGEACVDAFRRTVCVPAENMIEIRDAGAMGLGAFAKVAIPRGTPLGEYLGELLPLASEPEDDDYAMEVSNRATSSSMQFGNWTRFMNHRCRPNVSSGESMYGHRRAVLFRANVDIAVDEQLFISYGPDYFRERDLSCLCDSHEAPHHPSPRDVNRRTDADLWDKNARLCSDDRPQQQQGAQTQDRGSAQQGGAETPAAEQEVDSDGRCFCMWFAQDAAAFDQTPRQTTPSIKLFFQNVHSPVRLRLREGPRVRSAHPMTRRTRKSGGVRKTYHKRNNSRLNVDVYVL